MHRPLAHFYRVASILVLLPAIAHSATLQGSVRGPNGEPIVGARVGIATAAPLKGAAMFCPSCYLDCAKSTKTDAAGRFEIANVSDALKFQILFTATDHKSHITKLVDPAAGDVEIKLDAAPKNEHPDRTIRVQAVDDTGHPIEGALVSPCGAKTASKRWYGLVENVEPTVSDADGRFAIVLPEDFQALDIELTANGKAGLKKLEIVPAAEEIKLVVPTGTRVTGRLMHAGKPFAGLNIAVCQLDRDSQNFFIKAVQCTTDDAGRFDFNYLPPNQRYAIFTLAGEGATGDRDRILTTKVFTVKDNNQSRDLGDLEVGPSIHIHGRIEVPPGAKLPAAAKLMFSRDPAWDLIAIPIAADGVFEADGLPPEVYEISINTKNFDVDSSRVNYQLRGPKAIGIHVTKSIDDLMIPLATK
jgi:uncharacterized GH25 family protein